MYFSKLDDSPMFRKQMQSLEESAELLRERSLKFYKGCRKYTEGLGEGYDGDISFASSLEMFGGGHNDPICVAFGGPVMTKFTIALREIGTYKEVLRSQVEHMLNDRLLQFVNVDLLDVKEARKRFDKATIVYDQAREKYLSLRKSTRLDVASALEEELRCARSSFEQARFNLVSVLSNIEAKKRFEFLEAVSGTMDAHLRYFKQGYELLHQMEPYIQQVLAYAQQSRERSNYEQAALSERMQEFKKQIDRKSRRTSNGDQGSPTIDGIQSIGRSSHKMIEAVMQSASKGKVQAIRQGYLSKRSSNLRGDWKRRFFVLDSRGMLYYYRKQCSKPSGCGSQHSGQRGHGSSEIGAGLLSRWLFSHYHGGVHDEKSVAHHTVNLLTSTIKVDAEQSDLRFCFQIISPSKNYTLQAESTIDQMDWVEKITGVIASLLSAQSPDRCIPASPSNCAHHHHHNAASESSSVGSSFDFDRHSVFEENSCGRTPLTGQLRGSQPHRSNAKHEKPIDLFRKVDGNDVCADCGAPDPDWASLNLGLLVCIECSGVHRNLGVHISKVRSLTLDVKVWEPSVINLFQSLGNTFANSVWEELLPSNNRPPGASGLDDPLPSLTTKPRPGDAISVKEKFIQAKYAEKAFVRRTDAELGPEAVKLQMWRSVGANDKKAAYRLIVTAAAEVNTVPAGSTEVNGGQRRPGGDPPLDVQGLSLLHVACQSADLGMAELLLQYGANVNAGDLTRGLTPLHLCILEGKNELARLFLSRGADPRAADREGKTAVEYASEAGIIEEEMLLLGDANG
ncbi:ARF GTPase-activating protein [Wolffia australiana]